MAPLSVRPPDLTSSIVRAFDVAVDQNDREVAELIARALEIHATRAAARDDAGAPGLREKLLDVRRRLLLLRASD